MGCGCKKRKKALDKKTIEAGGSLEIPPKAIIEQKEYRDKVKEALKQFANLKIKKRSLRG